MKEIIRIVSNLALRITIPYFLFYGVLYTTSNITMALITAIWLALITDMEDMK
jgi:hypothetical protein